LDHLRALEAESIHIFREAVADAERPVMLFSAGKDSAVMLHLARKAFFPAAPPFPLLHVDTGWKFAEMYRLRDSAAAAAGMELIVHRNPEAEARGINPFDHGSALHTQIWKTEGLKQALDSGRFDVAFGGARRDEEASRAKERIFSFRTAGHGWDPKRQRPELWRLYNSRIARGESLRVFPLSNWTERDIWDYVAEQKIEVASLYFAAERMTVERDGSLIIVDDERFRLEEGETPQLRRVRVRTLGCYPLTGAVLSDAATLAEVIAEMERDRTSERAGRLIDRDEPASMERKKKQGYF
jgi:sulfate adenylyltransferase subunit 2